jgi:dTDP-4-amino-4,6-dideoxygalactose transaminase
VFGHSLPHYGYQARMTDISATVGATGLRYLP